MTPTRQTYDMVVVGGGVMGASIALHLAQAGVERVLLIEKSYPGAGSSGKSGAILRQHYSHKVTIGMARESLQWFASFRERHGIDIGFRQLGMVFICPESDLSSLERNVELQRSMGVEASVIGPDELRDLEPSGSFSPTDRAAFEPEAATVNPVKTVYALIDLASQAGAEIAIGQAVVAFEREGDRISGVRLASGEVIESRIVINAAGPWSGGLMAQAGVEVPLTAVRPEQAFFEPPPGCGEKHLVYGDLVNGLYWKPESAGWLRIGNLDSEGDAEVPDPDNYDEGVSGEFIESCRARIGRRLPHYFNTPSWGGCGALYTMTPDSHPLVGPVPQVEGLWLVSGFSGHGFKLAPAVGLGLASALTGSPGGTFETEFFSVDRFRTGNPITVRYGYGILG